MKTFRDRVAVVTGGANGIGLGLARRFLEEGMKVVIADINQAEMDPVLRELSTIGDVAGEVVDVSSADQVQRLADAVMKRFGAVHLLCNNAGVGGFQSFASTTQAAWEWIVGVDLWGPINGCRIFLPILKEQDEAHILNTASMSGFTYAPYNHPYNVAKAGVVALSEGLAREAAVEMPNLGVSVLCPAFVATSIADDERAAPAGYARRSEVDPEMAQTRARIAKSLSEGLQPSEVAEVVMQGIRERRMHIFSHPEWLQVIRNRADLILSGQPVMSTFRPDEGTLPK